MKLPNTEIMMIAAAAITLALEATPERIDACYRAAGFHPRPRTQLLGS
jgi:hypothetical protein